MRTGDSFTIAACATMFFLNQLKNGGLHLGHFAFNSDDYLTLIYLLWVITHKRGATDPSRVIICSVRRVAGVVLAELSALLSSPSLRHQMALELSSLTFAAPQQPQPGGHSSNTAFNTKQNIESPKRTCTYLSFHNTLHGGPLTQDKTISIKGLSKSRCC